MVIDKDKQQLFQKTEELRKSIPSGEYLVINIEGVMYLNTLYLSRSGVKNWRSHPYRSVINKYKSLLDLSSLFKQSSYFGWAPDEVIILPNGSHIQKHPDVLLWLYYIVEIEGEESCICVQLKQDGKMIPYCINDSLSWNQLKPKVIQEPPPV